MISHSQAPYMAWLWLLAPSFFAFDMAFCTFESGSHLNSRSRQLTFRQPASANSIQQGKLDAFSCTVTILRLTIMSSCSWGTGRKESELRSRIEINAQDFIIFFPYVCSAGLLTYAWFYTLIR